MTTDLRAHLDRLDTALAAATPGPWRRNSQPGVIFGGTVPMPIAAGYSRPDAALIVAAVNALPSLLAAVRAAAYLADELDGEATAYAQEADGLPRGSSKRDALLGRLLGKKAAATRLRTALAAALTEGVAR